MQGPKDICHGMYTSVFHPLISNVRRGRYHLDRSATVDPKWTFEALYIQCSN